MVTSRIFYYVFISVFISGCTESVAAHRLLPVGASGGSSPVAALSSHCGAMASPVAEARARGMQA